MFLLALGGCEPAMEELLQLSFKPLAGKATSLISLNPS